MQNEIGNHKPVNPEKYESHKEEDVAQGRQDRLTRRKA